MNIKGSTLCSLNYSHMFRQNYSILTEDIIVVTVVAYFYKFAKCCLYVFNKYCVWFLRLHDAFYITFLNNLNLLNVFKWLDFLYNEIAGIVGLNIALCTGGIISNPV